MVPRRESRALILRCPWRSWPPSRRRAWPRPDTIPKRDRHGRRCRRRCRGCGWDNGRCVARRWKARGPSGPSTTGWWKAAWRTQAPIAELVAVDREPRSASTPLMSTRWAGRARRNAMIGTRLWPPASTRPSSAATSARIGDRFLDCLGRVIAKRCWLHRFSLQTRCTPKRARTTTAMSTLSHIWEIAFFLD